MIALFVVLHVCLVGDCRYVHIQTMEDPLFGAGAQEINCNHGLHEVAFNWEKAEINRPWVVKESKCRWLDVSKIPREQRI